MGPTPIPNHVLTAGMTALAVAVLAPTAASAQWNNDPYQFRSNTGGGAGMSLAYRQAILNEELFGRRPENLVRGPDGRLLEIIRRDQQAFLADPEPNFLVGRRGRTGVLVGVGGVGFSFGSGGPVQQWTADYGLSAWAATRRSSEPVDAWTAMLD